MLADKHMQRVLWTIVTLTTVDDGFAQTTRPVDCSVGETIAAAVAAAKPGDTLAVRRLQGDRDNPGGGDSYNAQWARGCHDSSSCRHHSQSPAF